jgi:anti-anti-sigma regulatory factor
MVSGPFIIKDYPNECFRIKISGFLTAAESAALREEVEKCAKSEYSIIYIDAKDVTKTDLSGINEVIHSHYTLDKASKKLIFLYQQNSSVQQWVDTSGLDKFVVTAIVPAN